MIRFWRNKYINAALKVPDVEGTWQIEGHKLREDGSIELEWSGSMTIVQSWDFIRIHLKTKNSESDSISAAIICDKSIGFNLIYTYQNCHDADETHLAALNNCAEVLFNLQLRTVEGDYFYGRARYGYGTMKLTKVGHGA